MSVFVCFTQLLYAQHNLEYVKLWLHKRYQQDKTIFCNTDFILVSDSGKEFPCNKIILAFQSKVFEANFEIKNPKKFTGTNENLNQRMS